MNVTHVLANTYYMYITYLRYIHSSSLPNTSIDHWVYYLTQKKNIQKPSVLYSTLQVMLVRYASAVDDNIDAHTCQYQP